MSLFRDFIISDFGKKHFFRMIFLGFFLILKKKYSVIEQYALVRLIRRALFTKVGIVTKKYFFSAMIVNVI